MKKFALIILFFISFITIIHSNSNSVKASVVPAVLVKEKDSENNSLINIEKKYSYRLANLGIEKNNRKVSISQAIKKLRPLITAQYIYNKVTESELLSLPKLFWKFLRNY